jgi:hypothetical protein
MMQLGALATAAAIAVGMCALSTDASAARGGGARMGGAAHFGGGVAHFGGGVAHFDGPGVAEMPALGTATADMASVGTDMLAPAMPSAVTPWADGPAILPMRAATPGRRSAT